MLARSQFIHPGLWAIYRGQGSSSVPVGLQGRCKRLVDAIDSAYKADDTNISGMGYKLNGSEHSLNVDGVRRVAYHWVLGKAERINYV